MCSAVISNDFPVSDFWIISSCNWENSALTYLIESFGWSVSQSGQLGDAWPSSTSHRKSSVILAVVGKDDETNGTLLDLFRRFPVEPIILLMRNHLENSIIPGLPANVMAAVEANQPSAMLHPVLSLVTSGHRVLASHNSASSEPLAKNRVKTAPPPQGEDVLTGREKEVSREISLGKSNKDIARRLGISLNTVNAHTAAIRQKLGVQNRTQIALQMAHLVARPMTTPPSYARGSGPL